MELKKKDCLKTLSTTEKSNVKDLAPYIAAAIAEIFGGTVTCIEDKDPVGFYYLNSKGIASFVLFKDIDYKAWLDNPPVGVRIEVQSRQELSKFIALCTVSTSKKEYTYSFTGDTQKDAEFISILKSCLMFKRNSYLSEGMGFADRMQLILPQKKEKSTMRVWRRLLGRIMGASYGGPINRCTRVRD